MTHPIPSPFTDPAAVARYAKGPRRNVPGYDSLLPMVRILLAERVPANGRVLVVGAGGGLELEDMARAHPGWQFDGVDPSQPMLDLAAQRLDAVGLSDRVALHHGYVQSAPLGPFDGATCLLTFHFVPREERVPMVAEIRRRLKPGAPFVAVHLSVADGGGSTGGEDGGAGERDLWLSRYSAFQVASGMAPEMADKGRAKVAAELAVLTPEEDEAILREAGFSDVRMFYMGFAFRGWVTQA